VRLEDYLLRSRPEMMMERSVIRNIGLLFLLEMGGGVEEEEEEKGKFQEINKMSEMKVGGKNQLRR